jgi:hypothetical protein
MSCAAGDAPGGREELPAARAQREQDCYFASQAATGVASVDAWGGAEARIDLDQVEPPYGSL